MGGAPSAGDIEALDECEPVAAFGAIETKALGHLSGAGRERLAAMLATPLDAITTPKNSRAGARTGLYGPFQQVARRFVKLLLTD